MMGNAQIEAPTLATCGYTHQDIKDFLAWTWCAGPTPKRLHCIFDMIKDGWIRASRGLKPNIHGSTIHYHATEKAMALEMQQYPQEVRERYGF